MILTLLQKPRPRDESRKAPVLENEIVAKKPLTGPTGNNLRLTRSEEFLNGTHDIFDILVMQNPLSDKPGDAAHSQKTRN